MSGEPFSRRRCPACGKHFSSPHDRAQHERDKHGPRALKLAAARASARLREPEEPSMADLMVEASLNRAMGERNEDWIEEMFGDHLR